MGIQTIGVLGSGQMGAGIAQVAAQAGFQVVLQDVSQESLGKAMKQIETSLSKLVEKQKIAQVMATEAKARIQRTERIEDFSKMDLVIEAATEKEALKFELFKKL